MFDNEFFTGINYWGSESAINMWSNFNPESIEMDLSLLKDAGITHLRIFPLWPVFQPLNAIYGPGGEYEYAFGEEPLADTEAGRAGVSEDACLKFECFCKLAEKYDMKLIVALITGHMSFRTYNPPAFDGKALLSDPTVLKWQIRFVKYFVKRFKNKKMIIGWDLGNEPANMPGMTKNRDTFYVWCSVIADAIKTQDQSRPVVSGLDSASIENGNVNLKTIGEICDIHTTHPYNIFNTQSEPLCTMKPILDLPIRCKIGEDIGRVPTFVQEFGSIGYMNCSQKTEADFYRCCLLTALAHGCHGTMWWCAFDQGNHAYAPYRWNNIGSNYGFFDSDLRAKPLVEENLKFREKLGKIPEKRLPVHTQDATVIIPRDDGGIDDNVLNATYILAKRANLDVKFCYALDPIEDSALYIFPSISMHKAITKQRLDELLLKVRDGAVLYISSDTGLLRDIPEMTGVDISYREQIDTVVNMNFNGENLPIKTTYFLKPESFCCKKIAADENGEGVFFKHKYGKGYVYFLTLPLEKHLAASKGVFYKDNQPKYDLIYRELAKAAGIKRICDTDSDFIRLTEHKINDDSYYIFAINYNNKKEECEITFQNGYKLECVFGNNIENGRLVLSENDGSLFKAVKK
ncbi:MAG: cellulase family glycosylhydrolase [Clostridia bacterium]|nr:cellulase family glycosylhydrolase [Clostridia bacterium]